MEDINLNIQSAGQSQETINELNKPMEDPSGMSSEDTEFLNLLITKVENKDINIFVPSSLLNHTVYDTLGPELHHKAEVNTFNLMSSIRNIYKIWKVDQRPTFQIQNMVHQLRLTKENLEKECGDIYII